MTVAVTFITVVLAAGPITIDYRGELGEALNQIATKGDINLIATGELHTPAEVHLKNVRAEEALETLAKVHHLEIHREGKLWVVKPDTKKQLSELAELQALEALKNGKEKQKGKNGFQFNFGPMVPPMPPMPAIPPVPPMPGTDGSKVTVNEDGSKVIVNDDGSTITTTADGSKIVIGADGSTVSASADGTKVTVGADGSSVVAFANGSKMTVSADGTKLLVTKDGTKITELPDGRKLTESADGKTVNWSGRASTTEEIEAAAEEALERAEEAKARAEAAREEAEDRRQDAEERRDEAEAARADAEADRAEAIRERVEAARERAKHRRGNKNDDGLVTAGPVTVKSGETVGDVVSYGGGVTIEDGATVDGDAVSFGGDVVMGDGSTVTGDAVAFGGAVKKGDGATVGGEEVSFGGKNIGYTATSKVLKSPVAKSVTGDKSSESFGSWLGGFLLRFAVMFGLGFVLMMFAPTRMRNLEAEIKAQPVKSGLAGLLGLLASIPVTVLMCLTVIGIPFAMVLWLLAGIALLMGLLALANGIGTRLPLGRRRRTQAVVLAVGVLALTLVWQIPVLGVVVFMAALCVSAGALIRTRLGQRQLGFPVHESMSQDIGASVP